MIISIPAVRDRAIGILIPESGYDVLAVVLQFIGAPLAVRLQARRVLRSDTDAVADFDASLDFAADADGFADDLVADAAGVGCWAPS